MKQKIVIKVEMTCHKCRSKALALVAATLGVDSVALAGEAKDQLVVVGDDVDSVKLTSALRKKVGPAQLLQVGKAKEEEKKKPEAAAAAEYPPHAGYYYYNHYPSQPAPVYKLPAGAYGYRCHSRPDTCSIM